MGLLYAGRGYETFLNSPQFFFIGLSSSKAGGVDEIGMGFLDVLDVLRLAESCTKTGQ